MIIRDKSKNPTWAEVDRDINRLTLSDITWACGKLIALRNNLTAAIARAGKIGFELHVWPDFRDHSRFRLFSNDLQDIKNALLNRDYLK